VTGTLVAPTIGLPLDNRDITVHVVGAVVAPGVYTISSASRVVDAVGAAGGPASNADLSSLNMALPLADADQVFVPARGSTAIRSVPPVTKVRRTNPTVATVAQAIAAASTTVAASGAASSNGVVNINIADAGALESLPGVGPATAKAIIAHRTANGPFGKPEDLLQVKGIGDGKFAAMRQFVSVS
jgi:competence protein ComEA